MAIVLTFILLAVNSNAVPGEEWNRTFGRTDMDSASSVQQTLDGGFILAGQSMHWAGDSDAWIVKTDAQGNEQWNRTFDGTDDEYAYSIRQTSDEGFIVAGRIRTYDAEGHWTGDDAWLVKVSAEQGETAKAPTASPTEKVSGLEVVLAITIFLAAYVAARKKS